VVQCPDIPCSDVEHGVYRIPEIEITTEEESLALIFKAAAAAPEGHYDAQGDLLFQRTTVLAFRDAGSDVSSVRGVLHLGVYLTRAVKCGEKGCGIKAGTIKESSLLLDRELHLFPQVQAFLLTRDVAIRAVNYVAQRAVEGRVIPAGSTYTIRGEKHYFRGARAFPSYLQAGPSFFIEKSKRKMIARDLAAALSLLR
jgi:hypothetical protein